MKRIIIPQDRLLVIASAIKSEKLLYIAATSLSPRKANKIISKYFDKYLMEMQNERLYQISQGDYIFSDTINRIIKACTGYEKKIEILMKIAWKQYMAVETLFIDSDGVVDICYDKKNKQFEFCIEDKEIVAFCTERFLLEKSETVGEHFELEISEDTFVELLKGYGGSSKEYLNIKCSEKNINDLWMSDFAEAVYTPDLKTTLMVEMDEDKSYVYIYQKNNKKYLLATNSENGNVSVMCNESDEISRKIIYG